MRKILLGAMGFLLLLGLIMIVNTLSYGGGVDILEVDLPDPVAVDEDQALAHLGAAIRFPTITTKAGDPQSFEAGQPWRDLHAFLDETYPAAHRVMQLEKVAEYTLLYTWAGSNPSLNPIVLMAHQDVVPVNPGTADAWTRPAFSGEIAEGYIYGRGAMDDKASLIAIMEAIEALAVSSFTPQRTIILLFGHDEEVSGAGAVTAFDLLASRGVTADMVLDEGFTVIEDTPGFTGPVGYIGISEKGYMTLRLVSEAEGGHSSTPPQNSANVQLAKAVLALEETQMPAHLNAAPASDMFKGMAPVMGFGAKFGLANRWLLGGIVEDQLSAAGGTNAMIRTTMAPTMLSGSIKENVLPQKSTAIINFRLHPNDTGEDVFNHVNRLVKDIEGVRVEQLGDGIISEAAPLSPTDNKAYGVLHAVATRTSGGAPTVPALVLGATDSRYATRISKNIYRFMPIVSSMDEVSGFHGTNERMRTSNMTKLVEGYSQVILAMDADK